MAGAAAIRAGGAYVDLGANDSKMKAVLDRAAARLKAFGQAATAIGSRLAAAGTVVLGALGAAASRFASAGDQLNKMSARTGVSVEALSAFGFAMEQSGTSLEVFEGAVQSLQGKLLAASRGSADAQDSFLRMGLTWRELAGLSLPQQVELLAEQVSRIEHPARRAAAAMELFGSTAILPLLAGGAKGVRELTDEAEALGITMSTETAQGAADLVDATNRWRRSLGAVTTSIGSALGPVLVELSKVVLPLVKTTIDWVRANKPLVVSIAAAAAGATALGTALVATGVTLAALGPVAGVVTTALSGAAAVVGLAWSAGAAVITGTWSALGLIGSAVVATITAVWKAGAALVSAAWTGGAAVTAAAWTVTQAIATAGLSLLATAAAAALLPLIGLATVGATVGAAFLAAQTRAGQKAVAETGAAMASMRDGAARAWDSVKATAVSAWESVKGTATLAVGGINAAIKNGRWDLAFEIATVAIKLEWLKLTTYLESRWDDVTDYFEDRLFDVRAAWVETTAYLTGDWDKFTGLISGTWDKEVEAMTSTWQFFADVFEAQTEAIRTAWAAVAAAIKTALAPLDRFANTPAGRRILGGAGLLAGGPGVAAGGAAAAVGDNLEQGRGLFGLGDPKGNADQRKQRLDDLDEEQRKRREQRDKERKQREEELKKRREDLEKQLKELRDKANRGGAGAAIVGAANATALGAGNAPIVRGLGGAIKADVVGSFSGEAAFGFGGKTVMDRVAQGMQDLVQVAREQLQELKNPKRANIVED